MSTIRTLVLAAMLSGIAGTTLAAPIANPPSPRLKPAAPALSQYLSDADARQFRKGLSAAKRGRWSELKVAKDRVNDPVAKDVLRWLRSARDPNVPTDWLTYASQNLDGWPRMTAIRAKAEARLFDDPLSARKAIAWFQGRDPVSGEGRAVLARAHYALGDRTTGDAWLKSAWRDSRLTRDRQRELFGKYKKRLNAEDHAARADHLIWLGRSHFAKANALLPYMNRDDKAVMNARMQLARKSGSVNAAVSAVPKSRQTDPAFLMERAKWRRQKKSKDYALSTYLNLNTSPTSALGKSKIWNEKRIMAYWLIAEGDWPKVYQMSQHHGMSRGSGFAEAEFLAGWVALRKRSDPQTALGHFRKLEKGVSTPISLSRALYWQGRAHEALGDGQADNAYARASQYPNTYYGQLATSRRNGRLATISLPPEIVSADARALFEADTRVRALRLLGEAGEERYFSWFAFSLDDQLDSLEQLSLLAETSADYGFMRPSLRAAKQSGRLQGMLTESGYPIVGPIEALGDAEFDIPFVYAIARQESEFAAGAVSSAKAYGMMQMINATAKATARKHRIPYDQGRLQTDRDYAARMGALHLHDLLDRFDGSYVLAAVGYNAGPHRAKQWIERYGDPRTGEVDPIDWVDSIPFSETRNYVQRVLENMQVYHARRDTDSAPVTIDAMLRDGSMHRAVNRG